MNAFNAQMIKLEGRYNTVEYTNFDIKIRKCLLADRYGLQIRKSYATIKQKTPSKMDVAPWDKHWIKRELDCFRLYSMVFVEIQWYSMVFVEIQWYS